MTVDEVREIRAKILRHVTRGARTQAMAGIYEGVLDEIASMKAEYPGDAIIMRALARAAIGADHHDDAV